MISRLPLKPALLIVASLFLFNCKSDEAGRILTSLTISSSNGYRIDLGETTQLTVEGFDQLDAPIVINAEITWTSDNNNATVDPNGLVTGITVGDAAITASVGSISKSASIKVWDSSAPRTEIYVSDVGINRNGPHQILVYDEEGQFGEVFISSNLSRPQDIIFLEDQNLVIVSNLGSNNITKYDATTGAYLGVFASGLNGPTRMKIGPGDLLYVIQWNGGPVKRYQLDGTPADDFTTTSINQAIGLAWDFDGNLYVSSFNNGSNGSVRRFDPAGNDLGIFVSNNLTGPTDLWFDGGDLLVNDWSANRVRRFSATGSFIGDFITGVSQPEGVDFLDGNILIGVSGNGSVRMYDSEGQFLKDLVAPGAAGLRTTNAVSVRYVNY